MFNRLKVFLMNWITILYGKVPFILKHWLYYVYNSIKAFPKLIRYSIIDFSKLKMVNSSVGIDASSICQLNCPVCPTGKGINKEGIIGKGYLKFIDFKNFVNKNPNIRNIELSNWGEIFLNPDLIQIIKYAYLKRINLTAGNGANLNDVRKEVLESLVKYNFKRLVVSLDGAKNESYKIYRQGGDFNKVIMNLNLINYYKKKFHSNFPKLYWQFIIMSHNEHELPVARNMAQKLGLKFFPKLNRIPSYYPIQNKEFVRKESGLGVASRDEFFQKYKKPYLLSCIRFWTSPQINWDGTLLGCGNNIWTSFGNVFESGLISCLQRKDYIYIKQFLMGKKKEKEGIPCLKCSNYKIIKNAPLRKRDILINIFVI